MKELEEQDPAYMAALQRYKSRLFHKNNTSTDALLLRINSALHVRGALASLLERARTVFDDTLEQQNMDRGEHVGALEGAFVAEEQVCFACSAILRVPAHHVLAPT
jgi:hypothetical protein